MRGRCNGLPKHGVFSFGDRSFWRVARSAIGGNGDMPEVASLKLTPAEASPAIPVMSATVIIMVKPQRFLRLHARSQVVDPQR